MKYSNPEISPDYTLERVEFNTVYAGERMIAYIALPRIASKPFQSCIFFHGAGAIKPVESDVNRMSIENLKFVLRPSIGRSRIQWDPRLQTWASNINSTPNISLSGLRTIDVRWTIWSPERIWIVRRLPIWGQVGVHLII